MRFPPAGATQGEAARGPIPDPWDAEIRREERGSCSRTERYTIVGDVTLPAEGLPTAASPTSSIVRGVEFIPLIDATVSDRNGGPSVQRPFIAVAREHVQLAYEAQD